MSETTHHDELRTILAALEGVKGEDAAELRDHAERLLSMPEESVAALSEAARVAVEAVTRTGKLPRGVRPRRCPVCGKDVTGRAPQARFCSAACTEKARRDRVHPPLARAVDRLMRQAQAEGKIAEAKRLVREWQPTTTTLFEAER